MLYTALTEKEHLRQNKDLLELHKRCITDYLVQRSMKISKRRKFFRLYDHYIDEVNIREYFFRPIKLFIYALVSDRLNEISDYVPKKPKNVNKKSKRKN